MRRKSGVIHKLILILAVILAVAAVLYISGTVYYHFHIFPKTGLGGVSLANCTAEKVEVKLNSVLDDYVLVLKERDNQEEKIYARDVGLEYELNGFGDMLLKEQNPFLWPVHLFSETMLRNQFEVKYDEEKFNECINSLECMQEENTIRPVDAYISDYESGKGFGIVPEIPGTQIDREKFVSVINDALKNIDGAVFLEEEGCYVNPEVYSDTKELVERAEYYNKFVTSSITYRYGDDVIVLDGDTIYDWLIFKKNGKVKIDEVKVRKFVDSMGSKYDTIFRNRTFKTSYGKEIELTTGDYGWWMNRPAEVKEIIKLISEGTVAERKPVYFQEAARYGSRDYGNTYVEVNLTAQHLHVYVDGKVALESDFVSGKDTKDRKTPDGVYGITYKERDATLVGEDYETPVSYWMPFNGSIGLHDAIWRTKFGSGFYKTGGSHGCVNLPFYVAQKIYDIVDKGTPVICYYLPGTESASITSQGDEEIAQFVVDAIDRIGKIDKDRMEALEKTFERIRKSYAELSFNQKRYVTNLNKLDKSEKEFKKLKKSLKK